MIKSKIDTYLFVNVNYTKTRKDPVQFGKLDKTNNINEGIIQSFGNNNRDYNYYNVDYIKSINNNNKYYSYYLNNKAKDKQKYIINQDNIDRFKNKMYKCLEILQNNYNKSNKLGTVNNTLNTSGFVKKIIVNETEKIIIFGDYHGSYHTLFRNLLRLHVMGCIDLTTYKINDNYRIIFLGDLVDRGNYCFEIFDLLFNFIINNEPYKIIINRGNHEEIDQNTVDGFKAELKSKAPNDYKLLHSTINCIFSYFSTALILIKGTEKYWLCHGLIPSNEKFIDIIDNFINSSYDLLHLNALDAYEIRWNDTPKINSITRKLHLENTNSRRSMDGSIKNVGMNIINKFLGKFDLIIRGHEDSYSNAWLLTNHINRKINLNNLMNKTDFLQVYFENNIIKDNNGNIEIYKNTYNLNTINQIDRPIQTIDIHNLKNNNFVEKILTISTNTCYGRSLTDDSFIVLRFNNKMLPNVKETINNNIIIKPWLENIILDDQYSKNSEQISKLICNCDNNIEENNKIKYTKIYIDYKY